MQAVLRYAKSGAVQTDSGISYLDSPILLRWSLAATNFNQRGKTNFYRYREHYDCTMDVEILVVCSNVFRSFIICEVGHHEVHRSHCRSEYVVGYAIEILLEGLLVGRVGVK